MTRMSIDTFIAAADDLELSKYKVLAALQYYNNSLHQNKLYPAFADIVNLLTDLKNLLKQKNKFDSLSPQKTNAVDLKNKKFVLEKRDEEFHGFGKVVELLDWAYPKCEEAYIEGKAIFDFVSEQLKIRQIGLIPIYKNEGYFIVRNHAARKTSIYKYEMFLIPADGSDLQTLKTNLLFEIQDDVILPEQIKNGLIAEYKDLPNPATYFIDCEIDFPFTETILPIAKRKLMHNLAA